MSEYMLLIHVPVEPALSPAERAAESPRWIAYTQALADAGALREGNPVAPPEAATTVRERDGATRVTAGPPAATAETLGGYYVIDVADMAAAQDWAARIPSIGRGSVEIRPILASPAPAADRADHAASVA